jgi:prefoldin subunit 5
MAQLTVKVNTRDVERLNYQLQKLQENISTILKHIDSMLKTLNEAKVKLKELI